jgi:hypothetical protein
MASNDRVPNNAGTMMFTKQNEKKEGRIDLRHARPQATEAIAPLVGTNLYEG